ncbi:MAG: hypothetical protein ACI837_001338 [Crocinitomicaceae bacterium]|jgi:hypothetical protein
MKRLLVSIITITAFSFGVNAQNVNIPDVNFKAYLVGNAAINTNMDTEIQVSEASAFSGTIDCNSLSIADLTGVEAFTILTQLYCYTNSLTSIDVTQNTALTRLFCGENQLTSLDLSQNLALDTLNCFTNQITGLDVSPNTMLTIVSCGDNQFTSLNVANGNNTNFTLFNATSNPNLTCIEVDDIAWSTSNWPSPSNIDAIASFSENCCSIDLSITENANTITATLSGAMYQWVDCDNSNDPIIGATNQSFTPTANGNYACIIDDGNCSDVSACTAITTVGINELSTTMINISPNPASDQITIDSEEEIEAVTIFNMFGERVQQEFSKTFSIAPLSNGVYIMNIQTNNGIVRSRFIKE